MARSVRKDSALPLVTALSAAVALTGAAVFTVVEVGCHEPGQYVRDNGIVQLIGGCVEQEDLPVAPKPTESSEPSYTKPAPAGV